jgi:hypothetical protein
VNAESPDQAQPTTAAARHPDALKLPGWALTFLVAVFATAALAAASLRWLGVATIVVLVAGVCTLLYRWSG